MACRFVPVIGIPWSENNAELFEAMSAGAVFNLTMNTGAILHYEFAAKSEVLRSDTRIFSAGRFRTRSALDW